MLPKRSMLAAGLCAVVIAGAGASAAFAGEVKGPPGSVGHPGTPLDMSHANSICAFSGLNDFVNGPTTFIVQSYGQDVRAGRADPTDKTLFFPGNSCQGGSNPDHP
jgi:hypothetical protein